MKIVFATHNEGKLMEMRELLKDLKVEVLSAEEAGVTDDMVEDGKTLKENPLKKARFVAEKIGEWAVADDSGIFIEALGGKPGVFSSRWAGDDFPREDLASYTLEKMMGIPEGEREAYWESAVCLATPDGKHWIFKGRVDGRLALENKGKAKPKLPYDSIFIPEGHDRTFAEMSDTEKNSISHRGRAFAKLKIFLKDEMIGMFGERLN